MVSVSIFSSEKNQLQVGKNSDIFFMLLFAQKPEEKILSHF